MLQICPAGGTQRKRGDWLTDFEYFFKKQLLRARNWEVLMGTERELEANPMDLIY